MSNEGVTRIQKLPPEPLPAIQRPPGGVLPPCRIVGAAGEVQQLSQATPFPAQSGDAPTQLPFRAVSRGGRVLQDVAEIDSSTKFRLEGGAECGVDGAVGLGLIVRRPDGSYALPSKEDMLQKHEEEPKEDTTEVFSPELQGFYEEVQGHTKNPRAAETIMAKTINAAASGSFIEAGKELARFGGIQPGEAAEVLEAAVRRGSDDVARHLSAKYGVDGAAAVAFAATLPEGTRRDLMSRIVAGDASALKQIADGYTRAELLKSASKRK